MNSINYNNKIFKSIKNTSNGEVNSETVFHYFQEGNLVWATYSGGGIRNGTIIAIVDDKGCLNMRYQHANDNNELMTGTCFSRPEITNEGKIRMHEEWEWTCKDRSKGISIIEEQ